MAVITKITVVGCDAVWSGRYIVPKLRMDSSPSSSEWEGTHTEYKGSRLLQNIGNNLPQSMSNITEEYDIQRWHYCCIKSQQHHDYQHLKSHAMSTTASREIIFVHLTNTDYSREPSILAFYLNYYRWHASVHEPALVDQTAAKFICDCGKGNVS